MPARRLHTRTSAVAAALVCLWAATPGSPAHSIDFEKLVMPGPVIAAHAEVEGECSSCHVPFRAEGQDALCLECHEEVGEDLAHETGFHGLSLGARSARCSHCHTDHEGRDADVVGLDPAAFDHDPTDYPLRGAHRRVDCGLCHLEQKRFREAPSACLDCHRGDDVHEGELGPDCASCHTELTWTDFRFDHDATSFPLEGRHREVDCALCHANQRFENTPTDCVSCHRVDDAHLGHFGSRCQECHSTRAWDESRFDHGRDTRFPLRGSHRRAACESCHTENLFERELSTDCVSCHRADDVHRGRNGLDCGRCHAEDRWTAQSFDHDRMTDFPLRGAHASTSCQRCHTGTLGEESLETSCHGCHGTDDVHEGQQGTSCAECHNERSWTFDVFFEHDLAKLPLLGLHAVAACEQCHPSPRFKDAPLGCVDCHRADDTHVGRLGPDCARCHTPNGWPLWRFDHDTQTSFALHGAHEDLNCVDCHGAPTTSGIRHSGGCDGCHSKDDVHFGSFGRDCERCHRDSDWSRVELPG